MKKLFFLILCTLLIHSVNSQIKFDISKMKKVEVEKIIKEKSPEVVYFQMKYGGFELIDNSEIKKIENKIIKKIQYVYTDYPVGFDYSELDFQRFASLYVLMPNSFNKPWIEWEIVKQTKCSNSFEASTMFHGFIITLKEGPAPNTILQIPQDVQKKLDKITSKVELFDINSSDDISKFLSSKEIKINDVKYPNKNGTVKLFKQKDQGAFYIANGLFLTTGVPVGAIGPNSSPSTTSVNNVKLTPDKDLASLVGKTSKLFDASIVEFDVQIDADSLVFKYAFASEEYPEFLQFNDVFGLFISGPGLNNISKDTMINLATLPQSKTPISVSSINHLKNNEYYLSNDYTTDLKLFKTWQFDGFTKVLTAKIKVKPKQKYHIKFAIADFGDPYYDSAIFIDAFGIKSK